MAEIEISLSKKNLRLLIKHVFVGHWVMTSTKVDRDKELDDFYDTILSIANTYNVIDGLEYSEKNGSFLISEDKEQEMMKPVEEYEEDIFWQELTDRLALRDAEEKYGSKVLEDMEPMERMKCIWKEEEKYDNEFEKSGIDRLRIMKK